MYIRRPHDLPAREITDESLFWHRRAFLTALGGAAASIALPGSAAALLRRAGEDDKLTPYESIISYNNYYEFGTDKSDPKANAGALRTTPWTVAVEGEVKRPATYALDDLLKGFTPVERVYRHRCVEGWSMVVPWNGVPLGDIIKRLEPTSRAKFVEFTTLHDPKQMPGQR
jgi:sulfoxide reductase catalytic subunit YedY